MTDVRKTSGGSPVSNLAMVSTDQEEIIGNGTSDNPLRLGAGVGKTEFEAAFSGESDPQVGQAVAMVIDATPPTTVQAASAAGAFLAIGVVTAILDDSQVRVRSGGIVELTTAQWDGVTGGSGGLEPGAAYYVSSAGDGHLTTTAPSDPDVVSQVGVALDETRLLLQFMVATGAVGLAAIAFSGSATDLVAGTVPPARIGDGSLANAKLVNMPAHTVKGNDTGSAAAPKDLTATETKNLLAITATDVSGLAQIAITGNGANLLDNSVSDVKLVVMPTLTIKGNNTGGISAPLNLTADQVVAMLSLTPGDITGLAAIATTGSADDLVAGHVPAGRMPALTGAVTTTTGNVATTISAHAVANAQLAQVPALTLKGNDTGALANVSDLTVSQLQAMLGITSSRAPLFGDGSDGTRTMDGVAVIPGCTLVGSTYTSNRPCSFINLTINAGITWNPGGFPQFVKNTLTNNGIVASNGGNGGGGINDASGGAAGAAAYVNAGTMLPVGVIGTTGGNSNTAGTLAGAVTAANLNFSTANALGGAGALFDNPALPGGDGQAGGTGHGSGGGGASGNTGSGGGLSGGAGGPITLASDVSSNTQYVATTGLVNNSVSKYTLGSAGGGGSGASGAGTGGGGGGGAPGGWVALFVFAFAGTGVYQARGGAGGNGNRSAAGVNGGSGGGAGGGGGTFAIVTSDQSPPTPDVSGGASGIGNIGTPPLTNKGGDGPKGGDGVTMLFN